MRNISLLFLLCLVLLGRWGGEAQAQTLSVTSSTVGVRVVASLQIRTRVVLDPAATVPVWILEMQQPATGSDPCPTALTNSTRSGIRLSRAATDKDPIGWEFERFPGFLHLPGSTLCAILETGTTPQTLYISNY